MIMKRIPASQRSASLRYYYRKRRKFAPGNPQLTVAGQPRKRIFAYPTRAARRAARNAQQRRWHAKEARKNLARGLTTTGKVRVNRVFPELRGLASTNRREYSRQTYHVLKARRTRAGLAALVAGKGDLITRLK